MLSVLVVPADEAKPVEMMVIQGQELQTLQALVGGYVEQVKTEKLGYSKVMLVDEDGHAKKLPWNKRAAELSGYPNPYMIVGDAVFLGLTDIRTENERWSDWLSKA